MIRVLFVCSGNICRSPMADGVFQEMVDKARLSDQIAVDSAGTGPWHVGEKAHRGTRNVLKKNGIDYDGRARQITRADFDSFDYILAMDNSNLASIRRMANRNHVEVEMFLHYARVAGTVHREEVPDPYYDGRFDEVYDLVTRGSQSLLDHIRKTHDL